MWTCVKKLDLDRLSHGLASLKDNEFNKNFFDRHAHYNLRKIARQWGLRSDRLKGRDCVEFHHLSKQREAILRNIHVRRPMQLPTTRMERLVKGVKGMLFGQSSAVMDAEAAFASAQKELQQNLHPVTTIGDLIVHASDAVQLSAALIDRQLQYSDLTPDMKGRILLIQFIS